MPVKEIGWAWAWHWLSTLCIACWLTCQPLAQPTQTSSLPDDAQVGLKREYPLWTLSFSSRDTRFTILFDFRVGVRALLCLVRWCKAEREPTTGFAWSYWIQKYAVADVCCFQDANLDSGAGCVPATLNIFPFCITTRRTVGLYCAKGATVHKYISSPPLPSLKIAAK